MRSLCPTLVFVLSALALAGCSSPSGPSAGGATSATGSTTGTECANPGMGRVTGVILVDDFSGGGAKPAGDVEMQFEPAEGTPYLVRSEADGSYLANLPVGPYRVGGSSGYCAPVNPPLDLVIEACGDLALDITLELCLGDG